MCGCSDPVSEYGSLPDDLLKDVEPLCKDKTIEQLRKMGDYFQSKASKMSREMEKNVTMDQFDKVIKGGSDKEEEYK